MNTNNHETFGIESDLRNKFHNQENPKRSFEAHTGE